MSQRTHVTVGVIYNQTKDKVLLSKRTSNQHLAGLWEFPGGKIEQTESVSEALKRELDEELGIFVESAEPINQIAFDYPEKKIMLDVWAVNLWSGKVRSREKQELAWVSLNELNRYSFPAANRYIVSTISLPELYLLSTPSFGDDNNHLLKLETCLRAGLKIFQLRLKAKRIETTLIREIKKITNRYNAKFILNGIAEDINNFSTDGIHVNSETLFSYESRPISNQYLFGASCHNVQQLQQAEKINVDYVFISPVLKTTSHPHTVPMGWKHFKKLCRSSPIPSYALGGLSATHKQQAINHGAQGIAMLSSVWDADEPERVIASYLNQCL